MNFQYNLKFVIFFQFPSKKYQLNLHNLNLQKKTIVKKKRQSRDSSIIFLIKSYLIGKTRYTFKEVKIADKN